MKDKIIALSITLLVSCGLVTAQAGPNLYTWFEGITDHKVDSINVDLRIDRFPTVTSSVLYFWALNTQFSDSNWTHMGLQ